MAPFIESVLDQVKGDLAEALSVEKIEQICRELNYSWRECVLDPATTVHAFLRSCQKTGNDNRLTAARDLRPATTGPCPFHKENCHGGRLYAGGVF